MAFQKGHKLAPGGQRPGAGRKPNWFKSLVKEEMLKNKANGVRLVGQISRGEPVFERVMHEAFKIVRLKVGPTPSEIISANEFLRDSLFGKPGQAIKHSGDVGIDLFGAVRQAEKERGLVSDLDDDEDEEAA